MALTETGLNPVVGGVEPADDVAGSTTATDAVARCDVLVVFGDDVSDAVGETGAADDADKTTGDGLGVWLSAVLVDPRS